MKSAKKELFTSRLSATLGIYKISEQDVIHLIMAFTKAVCLDPTPFVINWTFIRNQHDIFEKYFLGIIE